MENNIVEDDNVDRMKTRGFSTKTKVWLIKGVMHVSALVPIFYLYFQAWQDQLGADPVDAVIHFTGVGALNCLIVTLMLAPLARRLRMGYLLQTRRLIGLYAFLYACLHLANYILFELQLDFSLVISEIVERPYITVGMVAFLILFALTLTSPMIARKRMGRKWQQLHNFVYLAVLLICIHFYWSQKADVIEPIIYFFIVFFLFWLRKDKLLKWIKYR
ncbi:protein-methionine-sulfoxide reductase heme-binding subunit MsrQ [Flocculibacter collagenilyticus]|uniref:protein-methionine-sulfoxide reductase heme-binding subunit MsrQ n=1 Tax=Flocculibacter collagenilyticus TaxID=2744479 RepID=UPI001F4043D0|nr:protein-methionine-sulfoxide reductase heme-binding subunit MsrQ [Flocculibacter collagenilyticus]